MTAFVTAMVFVLILWWVGTAVVMYLDGLPHVTFRRSMIAASVLLVAGLAGVHLTATWSTGAGAFLGFASAVLVWAWLELGFLTGTITGPRRIACPAGCSGPRHFLHGVQAVLWHEIAILLAAVALVALTWQATNRVALWTFLVLWGMRQSAKLNLFLGVPHPGEQFLPKHLAYLGTYFRRRAMNPLFPLSVLGGGLLIVYFAIAAFDADASGFEATSATLLATLALFGVIEHWMLIVPLPLDALWAPGLRSHRKRTADEPTEASRLRIVTRST